MPRAAKLYTVADIVKQTGKSDSTVRKALAGVEPAGKVAGYKNRQYAGYSKEQVAQAFPKAKKPAKAKA